MQNLNLQVQLYQMSETTFNGVSLFATTYENAAGATVKVSFNTTSAVNNVTIFSSATGESGSIVSINKAALLSALTLDATSGNLRDPKHFRMLLERPSIHLVPKAHQVLLN